MRSVQIQFFWLVEKLTFVLASMSQSLASMLAVREDSGGQEASRFDKPRRGGGSSVSWKYDDDDDEACDDDDHDDNDRDDHDDHGDHDLFHGG